MMNIYKTGSATKRSKMVADKRFSRQSGTKCGKRVADNSFLMYSATKHRQIMAETSPGQKTILYIKT